MAGNGGGPEVGQAGLHSLADRAIAGPIKQALKGRPPAPSQQHPGLPGFIANGIGTRDRRLLESAPSFSNFLNPINHLRGLQ